MIIFILQISECYIDNINLIFKTFVSTKGLLIINDNQKNAQFE